MKSYATPRVHKNWAKWKKVIFWIFYPALCLLGKIMEERLWRKHANELQEKLDKEHYDEQENWIRK